MNIGMIALSKLKPAANLAAKAWPMFRNADAWDTRGNGCKVAADFHGLIGFWIECVEVAHAAIEEIKMQASAVGCTTSAATARRCKNRPNAKPQLARVVV